MKYRANQPNWEEARRILMGLDNENAEVEHGKAQVSKSERHHQLCELLHDIYICKNRDYGDSFHETFVEEGFAASRIRLGDKFRRFENLTKNLWNEDEKQAVTDESIRDTLLDLANYSLMTVLEMDENE